MTPFARVVLWCVIFIVVTLSANAVPKQEHGIHLFFALCMLLWLACSALWLLRAAFRFIVR